MAKRLKLYTKDEIIFRANKLFQRHDELVVRCQDKKITLKACEILDKFPHVDEICVSLKDIYVYADEHFTILAPLKIEDVMREGWALLQCALLVENRAQGNSCTLFEKNSGGESTILYFGD